MTTHKQQLMYVYNLHTGNHHPSPPPSTTTTTTTKNTITKTLGSLLQRSKTYKENTHHQNPTKQEVVLEGRISGRVIEKGRKTVSGAGEGRKMAVAGRRSAENRAEMVMVSVGVVAEMLQVRVLVADMPGFMQVHAFRCVRQSLDGLEKFSPKQIACNMKKDFDKVYGPAWHCIVGSSFGSFVTHATGCFLYFSMENLYILVFKTKVQKNVNFSH